MTEPDREQGVRLTPEQLRNRRLRNIAIGVSVALLAALFYAVTIVKLGPGVLRPEP
jgi:4-hydroxybenzoate polyprenyltransferase